MKRSRLAVIAAIVMLTIGFAAVTTTLVINGAIGLGESEDFKVVFTSAKLDGRKRNDLIGATKKTINYSTEVLKSVNDKSILDYEVTNTSRNYDADVAITCAAEDNDYVDISYEPKKMVVKAGESDTGSITVKLIKIATKDEEINLTCTLVATPVERESLGEEYILDKGLMVPVNHIEDENGEKTTKGYFWDYKENITNIVFEDKTNDRSSALYTFDVSQNQDKSVMTYLVANEEDNSKYTLYFQSEDKVILNPISNNFFDEFPLLENIDGLNRVDSSNVTNMFGFFGSCPKLKSLDLSSFDTSNVTNMAYMFYNCKNLTNLDLSNFNTSNVNRMDYMFYNCNNLTTINVSNFNTSNVNRMNHMFYKCNNLTTLDVSSFNTSNVTNMRAMFRECDSLVDLDLSNFDIESAEDIAHMFHGCTNLMNLDISNFNFESVTVATNMFYAMNKDAIVLVKDEYIQNKVLNELPTEGTYPVRPSAWTTDNVVVKS